MMQMDILHPAFFERELELKCLKVRQPIGEFYIASIAAKELREITYSDVRRMEGERGFESYLGVQRPLSKPRVEEISIYTRTVDACFPTSVLLSVQARCAEYDEARGVLTLKAYKGGEGSEFPDVPFYQLANVIDGQHRIAGLDGFSGDNFEVNVSIFVDIDVATEAYLFSTVNLAQTKVNKSLVYDLYELATKKSPQKLCHEMAVLLDKEPESPFYSRIKRLGSAQPHNVVGSITQAAFVQALMRFISESPMKDRDTYMRGKVPHMADSDPRRTIFREFMVKDRDFDIVDIVWDYFDAVRERWPDAWNSRDKGVILSKTNGFMALVRYMRDCYIFLKKEKPTKADFKGIFDKMEFEDDFFTTERFKPGSSGESGLYKELLASGALAR